MAQVIAIVDDKDDTTRLRLELAIVIDTLARSLFVLRESLKEMDCLYSGFAFSLLQAVPSAFSMLYCLRIAADIAGHDLAQAAILEANTICNTRPAVNGVSASVMLLLDRLSWFSKQRGSLSLRTLSLRLSS